MRIWTGLAEMDMKNELREIILGKERNPKEILRDMTATEAKYKLKIAEEKKAVFVLRIGREETRKKKSWLRSLRQKSLSRPSRSASAKKETFEVDTENLTQMEFPEVKIVAESSEKTKFQNNNFEIYTPGHASVEHPDGGKRRERWGNREANAMKLTPWSTITPIFPMPPSSLNAAAFQKGMISGLPTPEPPATPLSALKEAEMESQ